MPSKKKKYNARFPAGRIKKIMQTDEEVGKVAQAVPIIISRTLELFVESLLTKSAQITQARNAKTLTPSHMKQCILSESRFDFLKDLVKNIPDAVTLVEDSEAVVSEPEYSPVPDPLSTVHTIAPPIISPSSSIAPNFYTEQGPSKPTPVIQYGASAKTEPYGASGKSEPYGAKSEPFASSLKSEPKLDFSIENIVKKEEEETQKIHLDLTNVIDCEVPPLIPLARNIYQGTSDNLFIDEDYDN